MADISKIAPNIQSLSSTDEGLLSNFEINFELSDKSCIEFYVYDTSGTILYSNYNYTSYNIQPGDSNAAKDDINSFEIDIQQDLAGLGFETGEFEINYNFLKKHIGDFSTKLYISEISSDRTEIRLKSNSILNSQLIQDSNTFIEFRKKEGYFVDFYLNFGNNQLILANNFKLEDSQPSNPSILVKLYEPLPSDFDIKSSLWVVTTINESQAFSVSFPPTPVAPPVTSKLSGPNFNIPIKGQVNNSSQNLSYNDIISGAPTSSLNQLKSLLEEKSINISVDYTNFSNFIHFSSAKTRLENFYYKASLIQDYSSSINLLSSTTGSNTTILSLQNKISDIIEHFDGYEQFLYYTSGSDETWPKTTTQPPYLLAKTGSSTVLNWLGSDIESSPYYGGSILTASNFDNQNNDQLLKSIPEYLREDSANKPYELFVDMVAQYYDNIWLYTKDVTQKYNADNRLNFGISKDLVSDAIKDFGLKLYQNNFSNDDLYTAFLGITPSGSVFPFPNLTETLPAPSGFEFVDTLISASNDIISMDDTNKSLYKRIYHNIPYLLKTKGTITGLRALITSYGIPDTILRISEFGGKDKVNENDWDFYFNKFNYAWETQGTNAMFTPWEINPNFVSHPYDVPGTVEFRFKTPGLPAPASKFQDSMVSQSLWFTTSSAGIDKAIVLEYTGSFLNSGSYSGSIPDPYYQYGTLKYISQPGTVNEISCSVYLPFFNGDWWSVMVRNNGFSTSLDYVSGEQINDFIIDENGNFIVSEASSGSANFSNINLFAANKIYNGNDGTKIGFTASSSLNSLGAKEGWMSGSESYFSKNFSAGSTYQNFSGSMQEIRYYNVALGTSRFYDYTMNPLSIEGNGVNASPDQLTFRAGLASEGNIFNINEIITQFGSFLTTQNGSIFITQPGGPAGISANSIHPKVTGSWTPIPSFATASNYNFEEEVLFVPNREYFLLDQFPAGIKNRITDKIRIEDNVLPPGGDSLFPAISILQNTEASSSYTDNLNYLEVAFSPQNQINDDIISQMGHFNIGDYIGDPKQRFTGNVYPDLNSLSKDYFKKYIKQYDLTDFIRLIKFFDNSLFKMIKDFIPTRTSLASGLVIKQHLLERNKYPQPQVSFENKILTGSIDMVDISGSSGGVFNPFNSLNTSPYGVDGNGPNNRFGITQSWSENYSTLSGSVTKLYDNQDEFYDGIFSGSNLVVTNGNLNVNCFGEAQGLDIYGVRIYNNDIYSQGKFLSFDNSPTPGYISLFNEPKATSSFIPSPSPPPIVTIPNTPTTMALTTVTMGNYNGDIKPVYYDPAQGNARWDFDETSASGSSVRFVSQTQNPIQDSEIVFLNQFGEVIQGITVVSLQVFQPLNGGNDISGNFTTQLRNANGEPSPSGSIYDTLIFKSLTQSICLNNINTETYAFNLTVSSSNTTGTSTNGLDGNTFNFSPRNPENNAAASVGNKLPFHVSNNINFVQDTILEQDWASSLPTNMEVYKEVDYWVGNEINIISFPKSANIGSAPAFNNGAGTTIPTSLSLGGLQLVGLSGAGNASVESFKVFRDSPAYPGQPNFATNISFQGIGANFAYKDFKFTLTAGGQLQVVVTNNSGEIQSGHNYYVGISIKDAAATTNAMYTIAFYKT